MKTRNPVFRTGNPVLKTERTIGKMRYPKQKKRSLDEFYEEARQVGKQNLAQLKRNGPTLSGSFDIH